MKKTKHIARSNKYYGWTPDLPDHRDLIFRPVAIRASLPRSVDLRPNFPPVYDQGNLGSCTANAIAAAFDFERVAQVKNTIAPSRLFIYYNERAIEGTVDSDSGAMIRDGIKTVAKQGVCPEPEWPYAISKFAQKPPARCYTDALLNQALKYRRILPSLASMRYCLASNHKPFVFGFTVYESFESDAVARTGLVPMPKPNEQVLGGHAVVAVGYDDAKQQFIVRNSWGPDWGDKGYCYMPYAYLLDQNLCDDRWTISLVET